MKPAVSEPIDIRKYNHPTGGWGSLKSLVRMAHDEGLMLSGIWSTLLKQNKADGYMCVSCSWAKPAEPRPFEFCENGYGYSDRLRGIEGTRMVLLMNDSDIRRLGLADGQMVDVQTQANDGVERRVRGLRVTRFSIPEGNCAGYYPELNPLIPLWHHARKAHVPAAKSVPIRIVR
jgi:hypothetical protein